MTKLNLFAIILHHLFMNKDQLITAFLNFISRYDEDNFWKSLILTKEKVREETLDISFFFPAHVSSSNTVTENKNIPLSHLPFWTQKQSLIF